MAPILFVGVVGWILYSMTVWARVCREVSKIDGHEAKGGSSLYGLTRAACCVAIPRPTTPIRAGEV